MINHSRVREFCCSSSGFIVNVKRIGAEAAVVSALAFTAFGMGAGEEVADNEGRSDEACVVVLPAGRCETTQAGLPKVADEIGRQRGSIEGPIITPARIPRSLPAAFAAATH